MCVGERERESERESARALARSIVRERERERGCVWIERAPEASALNEVPSQIATPTYMAKETYIHGKRDLHT